IRGRIADEQRVLHGVEVKALFLKLQPPLLERAGDVDLRQEAQKDGPRIIRQAPGDMACKAVRIERAFRDERRHSGAPVLTGNGDAVDDGILDARKLRKGIGDLDCRYILALPAERIADTVDEIEIAVRILLHQIAGAEPAVALLLDIAENFRLRRLRIGIALETVRGL